ncbi:cytochrome P450 89A2-like [Senna tora]|uniref:Cytochrome P450 89A2-like n=1 Tax=Senna tora TaxID=362788 RepID=A0A834TQH2_9FABA|nr:cytochrome P450 89A2-like [Senna tora]
MELCFIILIILILTLFFFFIKTTFPSHHSSLLPPGPPRIPIIGSLFLLRFSFPQLEPYLRHLHAKHGPIVSLFVTPSRPVVSISDRSLAHRALVQNGAVFSDRPSGFTTGREMVVNNKEHNISTESYGPTWRLLRRNLASGFLNPTRVGSFSGARKRALDTLVGRIKDASRCNDCVVKVVDHLEYGVFSLLVMMCFGERLDEKEIRRIECVQRGLLLGSNRFHVLKIWPKVSRILFWNRWKELVRMVKEQEDVLVPLVRARKKAKEDDDANNNHHEGIISYVDTLLDLVLPEEKRKLDEGELVSISSEFLSAGTDTTTTALLWIMANLVKYSHIQHRLFEEIRKIMGRREKEDMKEVREEDLRKLPYLKAIILEGLRRHPPSHYLVPHAASNDVVLNDYLIPKSGTVSFMVADMGWDPEVWEDPMEFKPERFLNEDEELIEFDVTGSKEIKMMPFGAGRRMCPAYNLAMLHLEYFVANLVWNFEWKKVANNDVDLSEKQEFTVTMKNPLQVHITCRR